MISLFFLILKYPIFNQKNIGSGQGINFLLLSQSVTETHLGLFLFNDYVPSFYCIKAADVVLPHWVPHVAWLLTFALSFLALSCPQRLRVVSHILLSSLKSGQRILHMAAYSRAGTGITLHYKWIHLLLLYYCPLVLPHSAEIISYSRPAFISPRNSFRIFKAWNEKAMLDVVSEQ